MKDKEILTKLMKYRERVQKAYGVIHTLSSEDLLECMESYALTQFLTNTNSLFQNIDNDDIKIKLIPFFGKSLSTCRNIASHDYDALNWSSIKLLCRKILSPGAEKALLECIDIAVCAEHGIKDYTGLGESTIFDK